jgi:hypothetical protein
MKLILMIILIAIMYVPNAISITPPSPTNKQSNSAQFTELRKDLEVERAKVHMLEGRLKELEADKSQLKEERERWWRALKTNQTNASINLLINIFLSTANVTFIGICWYRKGRLWNFYDSILSECVKQIKTNSIDRVAWESIELKLYDELQTVFNSLFRFEIVYLKNIINTMINDNLWIADSEANNRRHRMYTDKEQYCKYIVRKTLMTNFRCCGFMLFIRSIIFGTITKEDTSSGYTETNYRSSDTGDQESEV